MIDIRREELLTLPQAARAVPPVGGKRPHTSTLFRWTRDGVRGGIRLEAVRIGRKLCTSREALDRLFHALHDAPAPESAPKTPTVRARTAKQRNRDIEAARARLAAEGVGIGGEK